MSYFMLFNIREPVHADGMLSFMNPPDCTSRLRFETSLLHRSNSRVSVVMFHYRPGGEFHLVLFH